MTDNIIYDALVKVITRQFFQARTWIPEGPNGGFYVGGGLEEVLEAISRDPSFSDAKNKILETIKEKLGSELEPRLTEKTTAILERNLENYVNSADVNYTAKSIINRIAPAIIEKLLLENDSVMEAIKKKVDMNEYEINITFNVTARPKNV